MTGIILEAGTLDATEQGVNILEKLHINWLCILVVGLILAGIILGAVKGAFKLIYIAVAFAMAIILTNFLSPITKAKMMGNPKIYNFFYEKTETLGEKSTIAKMIANLTAVKETKPETSGSDSLELFGDVLDTLNLPESVKQSMVGDESALANLEISMDADVNEAADSMKKGTYTGITNIVVKAIAFLLTLLVVGVILAVVGGLFGLLGKIPGVDKVNMIAGGISGGFIALAVVWIVFAVFTSLSASSFGQKMLALIAENPLLTFIYNHNFITRNILS